MLRQKSHHKRAIVEDEFHFMMVCPEYEPLGYEVISYESWFLIHQDVYHDLFVCS